MTSTPRILVTPVDGLVDGPLSVRLEGYSAGQPVTLRASVIDSLGRRWRSEATFVAGRDGSVDLCEHEPSSGYAGVDATAMIWSMLPEEGAATTPWEESSLDDMHIRFEAERAEPVEVLRRFVAADVTSGDLAGTGLVGTWFRPAGGGPFPCALTVGGSAGAQVFSLQTAALFAAHGVFAVSLAYFGVPSVPPNIIGIELEYFERAFEWMLARQDVDRARGVVVMGRSRGGELAVLLGATFPQVRGVVGYTPAHVAFGGIRDRRPVDESAWSYRGQPIPHLAPSLPPARMAELAATVPMRLRPLFADGAVDESRREAATIAVERTRGPLLVVSGDDDQMWPADVMSEAIVERLARAGYPHPFAHLSLPDAGHYLRVPCVPTTLRDSPTFAMGGTPRGQAHGNRRAWDAALALVHRGVVPG